MHCPYVLCWQAYRFEREREEKVGGKEKVEALSVQRETFASVLFLQG